MDRQQDVIRRITAHVVAYRFTLENERNSRMAIEIKGLKADALTARANLDKLRAAYAKFNEAAPAHAADVEGLATTIGGMQSDLEFAATVMGNSSGESAERLSDGQKLPVMPPNILAGTVVTPEKIAALAEAAKKYDETVVTVNLSTDRDINRVALGPHPDQPNGATAPLTDGSAITASAAEPAR